MVARPVGKAHGCFARFFFFFSRSFCLGSHAEQGRVRTKTVKKAAKLIVEKYYPRLTDDFQVNKKICDEAAAIPSKRLRNKIAGYVTHLMKRIAKGPVRGISFALQEEERERKDNYVPEHSAIDTDAIEVDAETKEMLKRFNMHNIANLQVRDPNQDFRRRRPRPQGAN